MSIITTIIQYGPRNVRCSYKRKETGRIRVGKEETKISLFADDMMIYLENPRESSKKLLEIINNFGKVAEIFCISIY